MERWIRKYDWSFDVASAHVKGRLPEDMSDRWICYIEDDDKHFGGLSSREK
jgi:hypothetical protein